MHISSLNESGNHLMELKTKAMYFPACPPTKQQLDNATADIVFGNQSQHYIPFADDFTYLGSHVNIDLKDINDINNQLHQAKVQAASLGNFF
jgi:hypothetical protein